MSKKDDETPEVITAESPKVLYSPDGRPFEVSSPEEAVNLRARGYTETKGK